MVNPVPGYNVSTGYKKTGSHWTTCGWHTGQDYSAPSGADIVAARGGIVAYVSYGSSFGSHQFVVRPGDGTEDFYAHTKTRPASGLTVDTGQYVAEVGQEGNATGPHLHFERHSSYGWGCSLCVDPVLSHNAGAETSPPPITSDTYPHPTSNTVYLSKLRYGQSDSDSVWYLQERLNGHPLAGGQTLPTTAGYFSMTDHEVILCQQQHGYGNDAPGTSYVGPAQAAHLFNGSGLTIVED